MPKNNEQHTTCPVERSLRIIGNKWTMLIIRDLLNGTKRFGELQKSLQGISPRTLSQRLVELECDGIIRKKVYPEIPPRTEYSLTDKGMGLSAILADMIKWSEQYEPVRLEESK
jgi:DNA-binding HxlR family transcriptional regulator